MIAGGRVAVGVASEKDVPLVVRTPPFVPALDRPVPPLPIGRVPVTPVVKGRPVTLVITPLAGVPSAGVTSVGDVERTVDPLPVELVTPVPPLATARVPASVIAPDVADAGVSPVVPPANVVTPVVDVSNVAEEGIVVELIVPAVVFPDSVGVVRVGDVLRTTEPEPVEVVTPVPPLATATVPVTVVLPKLTFCQPTPPLIGRAIRT